MGVFVGLLSGLLVLINMIFFAVGIIILAVAGIRGYSFPLAVYIFIAGGVFLMVNCVGGCCLGFRKKGTIVSYGILMLLLVIGEVALFYYLIDKYGDAKVVFDGFLKGIFDSAIKHDPGAVTFVDDVQYTFDCCGVSTSLEYSISQVPESCCSGSSAIKSMLDVITSKCNYVTSHKVGCGDALYPVMKTFSIGLFCLEVVAAILAFTVATLYKGPGNRYNRIRSIIY